MKTLKLIALGIVLFVTGSIHAQVSVSVNIGSPPLWGPAGYAEVDYYYLPDVQSYYDIRASQFIYFGNGRWIRSRYLPRQYRNYDLYSGYKVVLTDYRGNSPYIHYKNHKTKYYKGYKGKPQRTIGNKHDNRNNSNNKKGNENKGKGNKKH
ncbi:hypothetical protein [Flavobacterium sp. K5-23]|uniref:hypothetical protein n=1 Tax=Flavobacterium sp. K5-23 TaxID=2746225 RepID=UPI00200DDFE4|nr:hypothetical protein [Flavobacterium sp. K5-23]UQD57204.1 hypothetical protein FLAK523_12700 [Flavobacterium sp. K5-23]